MKELLKEMVNNPWVIPVVVGFLWLLKYRSGIKKGATTAVKPFNTDQSLGGEQGEDVGWEATIGALPAKEQK